MNSPFGVDHGPSLREEYSTIGKGMLRAVPGGLKQVKRAMVTPKKEKLRAASEAGRAAQGSTKKFGGPRNVHPSEFDSRPAKVFPKKRKAWESGYYG